MGSRGKLFFFTQSLQIEFGLAGISKYRESNYRVRLTNQLVKDYVITNVIVHFSLLTVYKYKTPDYKETRNGCCCFINRKKMHGSSLHLNNCHNHT